MKKITVFIITFFFLIFNVHAITFDSENVVLYNLSDNILLEEKNKDEKISIASMTKIMTTIVAIENIENMNEKSILNKKIFLDLEKENASLSGYEPGQVVTYEDLLYGTFLPSGADAAISLAMNISGSVSEFVRLMNQKASEINLQNTHFVNVTGLDEKGHYSTVEDVAKMLKYALNNEIFKKIFTAKSYMSSNRSVTIYSTLVKALSSYKIDGNYIIGGKTGYTLDAGRCLASVAYDSSNDIYYLLVTAKASTNSTHLIDAVSVYEYYFDNYKYHILYEKNETIYSLSTKYAKEKKYNIVANDIIKKYLTNDFDSTKIIIQYDGLQTIKTNIKKGTKLGNLKIIYEDNILEEIEVDYDGQLHFSIFNFLKDNIIIILTFLFTITIFIKIKSKKKKKKIRKHR